jgi:hypothetical protein
MTFLAVTGAIVDNVFAATPACLILLATAKSADGLFNLWGYLSQQLPILRMDFANLAYYQKPALAREVSFMAYKDTYWPPLASFQGLQSHWLGMLGSGEDSTCAMSQLPVSSTPIYGVVPSYWAALFPRDLQGQQTLTLGLSGLVLLHWDAWQLLGAASLVFWRCSCVRQQVGRLSWSTMHRHFLKQLCALLLVTLAAVRVTALLLHAPLT